MPESLSEIAKLSSRVALTAVYFLTAIRKIQDILIGNLPIRLSLGWQDLRPMITYVYFFIAVMEILIAVCIWCASTRRMALYGALFVVVPGIFISGIDILLKRNSTCGCGLLGADPIALLIQKLFIIMIILMAFHFKRKQQIKCV